LVVVIVVIITITIIIIVLTSDIMDGIIAPQDDNNFAFEDARLNLA